MVFLSFVLGGVKYTQIRVKTSHLSMGKIKRSDSFHLLREEGRQMNLHEMQGNRCIMLFSECKYLPLGVQSHNSPYKLANFLSYITYNFERKCGSGM